MPVLCRTMSPVLPALTSITPGEYQKICESSKMAAEYWSAPPDDARDVVRRFRAETKDHYFFGQSRRCCYCSFELQAHHATFDAEHILDQNTYPEFMFALNNIAAACKHCNGSKGIQSALVNDQPKPVVVPDASDAYRIVHPHLDPWDQHLEFDDLNRIQPKEGSAKGKATIEVCGIEAINLLRLSDYFFPKTQVAESALRNFSKYKSKARKLQHLEILKQLAADYGLAPAITIVDHLAGSIEKKSAPGAKP